MRCRITVTFSLTIAILNVCSAQEPPVGHRTIDARARRSAQLIDEAVVGSAPDRFRPEFENTDRVHLNLTFSSLSSARVGLLVPDRLEELRAIQAHIAIVHALGWYSVNRSVAHERGSIVVASQVLNASRRSGKQRTATVNWPGVLQALRSSGIEKAEIRVRALGAPSLEMQKGGPSWTRTVLANRPIEAVVTSTDAPVLPTVITFGYRSADALRAWAAAITIVVSALLILFVARIRAQSQSDAAAAYRFFKAVRGLVFLGATFAWLFGMTRLGIGDIFVQTAAGISRNFNIRLLALGVGMMSGPLVVALGGAVISRSVESDESGRDTRWYAYYAKSLFPLLLIFIPLIAMIVGYAFSPNSTSAFLSGSDGKSGLFGSPITVAVILTFVSILSTRIALMKLIRPAAVEKGEIVDRVVQLCRKAEVNVSKVMIGRTQRDQVANALVSSTGTVILTDYLLKHFTREEVDAVVAHELAHLKLNHLAKRVPVFCGGIAAALVLDLAIQKLTGIGNLAAFTVLWIIPAAAVGVLARRQEIEADLAAIDLTSNPRLYIQMLKKLSSLQRTPAWMLKLLTPIGTHPSTEHRIQAVAARHNLAREEVDSLIESASKSLHERAAGGADEDIFIVPDSLPQEELLFTAQSRAKRMLPLMLVPLGAFGLSSLAIIALMKRMVPDGKGPIAALIAIVGMIGIFYILAIATKWVGFRSMLQFRRPLMQKLSANYSIPFKGDEMYVGFSPGPEVRIYDGETSWDIGFLSFHPAEMSYLGERASFSLTTQQIVAAEIKEHKYPLMGAFQRIYITWRSEPDSQPGAFNLEPRDARSARELKKMAQGILRQIEQFIDQASDPVEGLPTHLPPLPENILSTPLPAYSQMRLLSMLGFIVVAGAVLGVTLAVIKKLFNPDPTTESTIQFVAIALAVVLANVMFKSIRRRTTLASTVGDKT